MDILRLNFHRFFNLRFSIRTFTDWFIYSSLCNGKCLGSKTLFCANTLQHYQLYVTLYFTQAVTLHRLQPDMAKLLIDPKLLIFYQSGLNFLPNYHFAVPRSLVRRPPWVPAEDASPERLQVAYKLRLARVIAAKDESWLFEKGLICSTRGLIAKIRN